MSRGGKSTDITSASLAQGHLNNVPPVMDTSEDLDDKPAKRGPKKKQVAPVVTEANEDGDLVDEYVAPPAVSEGLKTAAREPESVQEPASEYASMGMFDKVKLMGSLHSALLAEDVKSAILSKPSGDKVYSVFSKAMEAEIAKIMGGEAPIQEATTAEVMGDYFDAVNQMSHLIRLFGDQKLINLLANMLQQTGGVLPVIKNKGIKPPVAQPKQAIQQSRFLEEPRSAGEYNDLFP